MTQIFISYSRRDLAFVKQLAADLQAAGLEAWYDLSGLEGGQRWRVEIEKAIRASNYVVVVLSPDSVASEWVEREYLYANNLGKEIIPIYYKNCEIPIYYLNVHFIDIQGDKYKQNFYEILRALGVKAVAQTKPSANEVTRKPLNSVKLSDLEKQQIQHTYKNGISLFQSGQIDDSITAITDAINQQPENQLYKEKLEEIIEIKNKISETRNLLALNVINPEQYDQIKNNFQWIEVKLTSFDTSAYDFPPIKVLKGLLLARTPIIVARLNQLIWQEFRNYDDALYIDDASNALENAEYCLNLLSENATNQEDIQKINRYQQNIDIRKKDLESFTSIIDSVSASLGRSKGFWRANEVRMTKDLRRRYRDDPSVKQISKQLQGYIWFQNIFRFILILILLIGAGFVFFNEVRKYNQIMLLRTPSATLTPYPTGSPTPIFASPEVITPMATPLPTEITDDFGVEMMLVSEGTFIMGSDWFDNEKPIHIVEVNNYYIDKYEVTNASYRKCLEDTVCIPPTKTNSYSRNRYFSNPEFDNYPVIFVSWEMADDYCKWRGARLPTEAEWEKAARGSDERTYPWGEGISCDFANYYENDSNGYCIGDTMPVGNYPKGKSSYGLYDMGGNVWEWVADRYGYNYYSISPQANPKGSDSGNERVLRGGSWGSSPSTLRSANRQQSPITNADDNIGFRCARDITP